LLSGKINLNLRQWCRKAGLKVEILILVVYVIH
jgi:hypothetical protein